MSKSTEYSTSHLKKDILAEARAMGLAAADAELIATRTAKHVDEWVKGRTTVTTADIRRVAAKKLKELNKDLAYFYQNNDKII